jgi:cellulose biosynthesis protein BcsQ
LSELFLGGLEGQGATNLNAMYTSDPRRSIGGYFQLRLGSPFNPPANLDANTFISTPSTYNANIPANISLVAGDRLLEIQSNAISSLAISQIPGVNPWLAIIDWVKDLITSTKGEYHDVFIDTNPSFSMHTQIAIASAERLILPVMADDSSRRAIQNVFTLVYGINVPSPIYDQYLFSTNMSKAGRVLPKVHLILKNRITQFMGEASAFGSVMQYMTSDIQSLMVANPNLFTFTDVNHGVYSIRDFGTTGVVAFAEGTPFKTLNSGNHNINGRITQIDKDMLTSCNKAIDPVAASL